jgi:hypothetical protein
MSEQIFGVFADFWLPLKGDTMWKILTEGTFFPGVTELHRVTAPSPEK